MRAFSTLIFAGVAGGLALTGTQSSAADTKTASGTIKHRATATFSDGSSADRLYAVTLDSDSDGDGVGDEAWLRVACSGGVATKVHAYSLSGHVPHFRTAADSQVNAHPSGKRMHKPFKIIKQWDRGAAGGAGRVQWEWDQSWDKRAPAAGSDVKSDSGKRAAADGKTMALDDWTAVRVNPGKTELCD